MKIIELKRLACGVCGGDMILDRTSAVIVDESADDHSAKPYWKWEVYQSCRNPNCPQAFERFNLPVEEV